ncbi:hypothetical protein FJW07_27415 [Mesorhizobium sp. B3-1-9]|uniref:hypothetical protein n=1 Tax=unclassified Mesorhizobium TaxID=325217 RepID=UPI00112EAB08|nr:MULTISPECIES: hypothetical protein [unclassified Mesorhizobium]TPI32365.1 hypothetical protein FJW07_27415 [Mesorhizobium sp. B3-1-9]TPI34731.1 hypothetical protein FJ414_19150 [Mesorhizobium sp. B3-1-6]
MNIRFVTNTAQALLDYLVALSLIAMPFLVGLRHPERHGIAIFVLPCWLQVVVDRLVSGVFIVVPFVLGFQGLEVWYYWAKVRSGPRLSQPGDCAGRGSKNGGAA